MKRYGNSRAFWTKEDMERRDLEIEILKEDYCTEAEAIAHLEKGTAVFDSIDEYIEYLKESVFNDEESFKEEYGSEEEVKEAFKKDGMHSDNRLIKYNEHEYIIVYVF